MKKKLGLVTILGVLLVTAMAFSAFAVQAAPLTPTETPVLQPNFDDGRLNAFDPGAPIVVYESQQAVPALDDTGAQMVDEFGRPATESMVSSIQVLRWDGDAQAAFEALNVSIDDINAAIADSDGLKDVIVASNDGISLHYAPESKWFWVMSAPDFEGKVYTFSWAKDF